MNRLDSLFKKLGYDESNGLFLIKKADNWIDKFPYRIGRVLRDVIKPYAFYSPFYGTKSNEPDHPAPLNNPIILFFDRPDEDVEQNIPRWTFSFSQAPIVFINRGDSLEIYHGYNFDGKEPRWLKRIDSRYIEDEDFSVFNLTTGKTWEKLYNKYFKNSHQVDKYLLKNIIDARRILIAGDTGGLSPKTANRLIGRLLFIRYLIDRNVNIDNGKFIAGGTKEERRKSFEALLYQNKDGEENKRKLYIFFKSITEKFNGDLFPLKEKDERGITIYDEEKEVNKNHLEVLYHLFTCSKFFSEDQTYEGYAIQKSLFNVYDFEVIPVELISNLYETFLKESNITKLGSIKKSKQKEIQAHYTPPFLVDYVLSQTVAPHLEEAAMASCKVLDPACGSGIFLVETLRKLIEKEIKVNPVPGPDNKPMIPDSRLWELVTENIFGIDIDNEAIEIAIFSLYITILDYKTPKEIESFRFQPIKNINLFGGKEADFFNEFNENHPLNKFFTNTELDFIIGNPPWGKSAYKQFTKYISNRKIKERQFSNHQVKLEIDREEISQAFMVRVSDFIFSRRTKLPKCVLIVSGKNFYNTSEKVKEWRDYFLSNFHVHRLLELSSVNTKIVGGKQLFESARQPTAIISFSPASPEEDTAKNKLAHITVRASRFFHYFKTLVIEKHDVKKIRQGYFMESRGGYDWLWKVLLHGNVLDFYFIKRLKEDYQPLGEVMEKKSLVSKRGLQATFKTEEGKEKADTTPYLDWHYLEIDKNKKADKTSEFQPYSLTLDTKWKTKRDKLIADGTIDEDGKIGRLPDIYFFEGKKLLIKRGLQAKNRFKAVAAFSECDLLFPDSVISVKPVKTQRFSDELETLLKTAAALINSKFFTYFLLSTGSSLGVDRTRGDMKEFLAIPIVAHKELSKKVDAVQKKKKSKHTESEIDTILAEIEEMILQMFAVSEQEKALIDYALEVSIPLLKREEYRGGHSTDIYNPLSIKKQENKKYLEEYAKVFIDHFGNRFNEKERYFVVDIYVTNAFIGFHFQITKQPDSIDRHFFKEREVDDVKEMIDKIGVLGYGNLSKDLYIRQDIRGFNETSFYVIKPNQRKLWHKAVAYWDLSEFISSLVKAELKQKSA